MSRHGTPMWTPAYTTYAWVDYWPGAPLRRWRGRSRAAIALAFRAKYGVAPRHVGATFDIVD